MLAATAPIANQKLGIFRRLVRGDSFRVLPAEKGAGAGASSSPSGALSKFLPPARILDLSVEVDTEEQQIEFAWTAPGEDYDNGKVCLDASFCFVANRRALASSIFGFALPLLVFIVPAPPVSDPPAPEDRKKVLPLLPLLFRE